MKHAVIVAHPNQTSFTMAMARAYAEGVQEAGGEVLLRDLYGMGFDPCLHAEELIGPSGFEPGSDVKLEREMIGTADIFALIYPFWFNAPPAILKGYIDRVFGSGFGFQPSPHGAEPLLKGRKLISFSSSGAPNVWVESSGAMEALRKLFDQHIASVCGMTVVDHLHFGQITPGVRADFVQACAARVKAAAQAISASSP